MASTACSSCQARVASEKCALCNATLCEECLVRCRVCRKVVCGEHFDVTDGGRRLCTECMRRRAIAKAERRERKEREREKAPASPAPLSFEALSEELGPSPVSAPPPSPEPAEPEAKEEPASTSFEALNAAEDPPEVEEVAAPKSANYQSERQTVRLPIDENRPILTGSAPQPWPKWVYLFPLAFALALGYWIVSKLLDAAAYF